VDRLVAKHVGAADIPRATTASLFGHPYHDVQHPVAFLASAEVHSGVDHDPVRFVGRDAATGDCGDDLAVAHPVRARLASQVTELDQAGAINIRPFSGPVKGVATVT
jgi:hypothetical protein